MLNSADIKVKENLNTVFKDVKLNPNDKQGGYGLIYALDKTGEPINVSLKGITPTDNIELPETHAALGGQYVYLLSSITKNKTKMVLNAPNPTLEKARLAHEEIEKRLVKAQDEGIKKKKILEEYQKWQIFFLILEQLHSLHSFRHLKKIEF
jgi:hypothetical protein